ncbi:multiple sugar transport system substrate-binding protein [Arboricoccus pini]|uniref:Multiple sugar transport system substrate-binding protein n=1 Tax=Arboricoccus pini TaxID=1963835 RepID=A0A212RYG1_9PROT|nr:ABC transporter substrate-binding protein [Arboricoccus pini]SNB77683.1 multiple sugar transport system substrate-binding protein [Arboricoccus pini]
MRQRMERFLASRRAVLQGAAGLAATTMLARPALAAPAEAMTFIGWQFAPQIVEANVATFKKLYDENVNYELVTGDYHPVAETKLMGGQHIDMLYSEEDHIARWNAADWTRDLEGLEGVEAIKAGLYPVCVKSLSLPNGKLAGLPYYAGHDAFIYNEEHLAKAKLEVPDSFDALLDACRKLKKDGISDAPYNSAWGQKWPELSWSIFACWYSEGAKVFDANNDLVPDEAFRKVLELHRSLFKEGLVTADIMTLPDEGVPSYATGQHTFMILHDYDQKVTNDPSMSKAAGKVRNALMPGKTHSTLGWTSAYLMGAKPVDEARVWDLMRFFGGKAKDGQYHVIKRWALEFGLGSGYKEVMADPDVVASFSKWRDLDVTSKQIELATSRDVAKMIWFSEWDLYMMQNVQEYIRGSGSTDELVDKLTAKVAELKKQYQ